jgi:hypothetical protein
MGRAYGGILGCLAFSTVLARGLIEQDLAGSTVPVACICLFGFAAIGYIIGRIADGIVADSIPDADEQRIRSQERTRITPV